MNLPPALCRTSALPEQSTHTPASKACLPAMFSTRTPVSFWSSMMASTTTVAKRQRTPCRDAKASATRLKGSLVRFSPSL